MVCMGHPATAEKAGMRDRAKARRMLQAMPWGSDAERIRERVRRDAKLDSEERFRAQLALLALVDPRSEAAAAAKRWHDQQDAIERKHYLEAAERYERRQRLRRAHSGSPTIRHPGA